MPSPFQPTYKPGQYKHESPSTQAVIDTLNLLIHPEGGYFSEIDRDARMVQNPFPTPSDPKTSDKPMSGDSKVRNASTSIYYLLSPVRPQGHFHRNLARTVHTLISGRGRYVLIHADEDNRVESFTVGKNVATGEKAVWIVEGGKYKASYLFPAAGNETNLDEDRLLISETVVPGFEYADHDFLTEEGFRGLVSEEEAGELEWLVRKE